MRVCIGIIVLAVHFVITDCRYALHIFKGRIVLIISFEVLSVAARLCTANLGWPNIIKPTQTCINREK